MVWDRSLFMKENVTITLMKLSAFYPEEKRLSGGGIRLFVVTMRSKDEKIVSHSILHP